MHAADTISNWKTKERTIAYVIAKVSQWRRLYNGYYDSSSGGEDADGEASLSPAKKRQREVAARPSPNRRAQVPAPVSAAPQPTPPTPAPQAAATQLATALGGVQFPPGLLAANPGPQRAFNLYTHTQLFLSKHN